MRKSWGALGATLVAALALGVAEATDEPKGSGLDFLAKKVHEIKLDNGLRLLVLPRHDAPVVAFVTAVNVGSVDENTGETGLAHMFEHMAFKGSTNVGTTDPVKEKAALDEVEKTFVAYRKALVAGEKTEDLFKKFEDAQKKADEFVIRDEYSIIVQRNGGAGLNAFTAADMTVYHVNLPANRAELWFMLEADRFKNPVLREFYKEKGAVQEERRMRVESNPIGGLFEEYLAAGFRAHPYGRPTIGHMSDLDALSATTAKKFFDRFYTPNNMTIALVGDIEPAEAEKLAKKYFGDMPRGPEIEPVPTLETQQHGERRVEFEADAQPLTIVGWHIPAVRHPDTVALDALSDVLSVGRTSRLHQALVVNGKIAVQIQAGIGEPGQKYPNMFLALAVPADGKTNDDCVKAIEAEIEKVVTGGVTQDELTVVKTRAKANFLRGLRDNMGIAQGLAIKQNINGTWKDLFEYPAKIEKLTPEDLKRVAEKYLTHSSLVRGDIVKPYPKPGEKKPEKSEKDSSEKKGEK